MKLFTAPQGQNLNQREKANLYLTWQISLALTLFLFFLALSFAIFQINGTEQYTAGFLISISTLIWTYKTKNGKSVSYFLLISSAILISISIFFDKDSIHVVDPMWLICITLYGFISQGRKVGFFFVIYSSLIYSYYVTFMMKHNLVAFLDSPERNMMTISIEISACIFIIGHFINHFIKTIDATEQSLIQTNNELVKQDHEKTVLLQEIHHRVKNNLQIIISLLRMQSNELESPEAKAAFAQTIDRVMSMALIHQKMYEEKHLDNINPKNYLNVLIKEMILNHETEHEIKLKIDSDLDSMHLKSIVPFGLITTELVSNSLKHAFKGNGLISISIINHVDSVEIIYSDNGEWKAPSKDFSFGSELIEALVQQLDGEIKRTISSEGTTYCLKF